MAPPNHLSTPGRHEAMRFRLNQALLLAGLQCTEEGKLERVEAATTLSQAESRARAMRVGLERRNVHPEVLRFCSAEWLADDYFHAVQEAVKSVMDRLRKRTGLTTDGGELVAFVLGGEAPVLAINPRQTKSEKDEQKGFVNLLTGVYGMFRNPTSHPQPDILIGESMKDFLVALGINTNGGPRGGYTMFKRQMEALAACRLMLGFTGGGRAVTLDAKPISRFDAWLHPSGEQRPLWLGLLELSQEYFDTLTAHAVQLDHRALGALKHSGLALDLYTWLAHRLCRVRKPAGVKLSWENLREQFGQEYADPKNFKKEFRQALRPALAVYPDARVEEVMGGLVLRPSSPPMPKMQVAVLG